MQLLKIKSPTFIRNSCGLFHRGVKRAYVAVAHSMLIAIYHILKDGVVFKDLGAEYYNQFNKEHDQCCVPEKVKSTWLGGSYSCHIDLSAEFKKPFKT